ncbi:DUF4136 domain-containing protein [Shewanella gelidii]|nr:DUF4136 domain-containing protein [Shewanella gelidii]MCL1097389.1 DUF4136 domain-containing protein [Shewanella gelidii]
MTRLKNTGVHMDHQLKQLRIFHRAQTVRPRLEGQMLSLLKLLLMPIVAIVMTACVSANHPSMQDPVARTTMVMSGDIEQVKQLGKRFAWHPAVAKVIADNKLDSQQVIIRTQQYITEIMQQKGYQLAENSRQADVLIGFGIALESSISDDEILSKAGLVAGLSSNAGTPSHFEKGSVFIGFSKPKQTQMIWRVLAQGYTDLSEQPQKTSAQYQRLLSRMLNVI